MRTARPRGERIGRDASRLIAVLVLLAAGCGSVPRPAQPFTSAGKALAVYALARAEVHAMRAEARVDQRGSEGRIKGTVLMFVVRPSRVRFDVMTQFGMLTEAGVRAGLDALAGEINADMPTAPIANAQLFQGSIFQRLGALGGAGGQSAFSLGQLALAEGAAQPEVSVAAATGGAAGAAATGLWVRAHGLFGQVDGDENGAGNQGDRKF